MFSRNIIANLEWKMRQLEQRIDELENENQMAISTNMIFDEDMKHRILKVRYPTATVKNILSKLLVQLGYEPIYLPAKREGWILSKMEKEGKK